MRFVATITLDMHAYTVDEATAILSQLLHVLEHHPTNRNGGFGVHQRIMSATLSTNEYAALGREASPANGERTA